MALAKKKKATILWAIDPFEKKMSAQASIAAILTTLSHHLPAQIVPFAAISPGGLPWPISIGFPIKRNLAECTQKTIERILKKVTIPNIAPPVITVQESSSRHALTKAVIQYTKEKKVDYILVNTRRLQSSLPFKIGGFTEALMAKSDIPILSISPKAKVSGKMKRILFPTDFSRTSHKAFRKTLTLAKQLNANVILLHVNQIPDIAFVSPEMALALPQAWVEDTEKYLNSKNKQNAKHWIQEAKK